MSPYSNCSAKFALNLLLLLSISNNYKHITSFFQVTYIINDRKEKVKDSEGNNLPLILIAEDNAEERKLLGKYLKKEPCRISIAENGRQTIETVANAPPDLILLDVLMPEMDGFEVCKKLKESPETRDIPIIFITAKTERMEN